MLSYSEIKSKPSGPSPRNMELNRVDPFPTPGFNSVTSSKNATPEFNYSFSNTQLFAAPETIQSKLTVNSPGDKHEQEADKMADSVMEMPNDGKQDQLQRKPSTQLNTPSVTPQLHDSIQSSRRSGNSLDGEMGPLMSKRFGVDFSNVRIHADNEAALMNQQLNARAFTIGNDIYFNVRQYRPQTQEGKRLLAHELTHVVQQSKNIDSIQRKAAPEPTEQVTGTLWAKDAAGKDLLPSLDDIAQGGLKNCYLFATMAAIVHTNPRKIVNMIKDNGNGTYTVTFEGIGFFSSATQTVSADFVIGKHGKVAGRNAFWPLIIEKAYAQQLGGLSEINKGGNPGDTVDDMLDDSSSYFDPRDESVDYIMGKAKKAIDNKWPIIVSTPKRDGASKEKIELADKTPGLYFNHAYPVINVDPVKKQLKLFNPWGYDHPNGTGWLDVVIIRKFFAELSINN